MASAESGPAPASTAVTASTPASLAVVPPVAAPAPADPARVKKLVGLGIGLLLFGASLLLPPPAGLSVAGLRAAGIFFGCIAVWVAQPVPPYVTALVGMVLLAVTGAWEEEAILGVFGYDVIWLMIAAFVITSGMEKSGIAKRVALFMVSRFGDTAKKALLAMLVTNLLLAFAIPATTARAVVMLPIAVMLAEAYGALPGKSNFGRLLMIQGLQSNNLSTSGILTATSSQVMAIRFLKDMAGVEVSWTRYFVVAMPIAALSLVASYLIGLLLFPPEVDKPQGEGISGLRRDLAAMGPMSRNEWRAVAILGVTLLLWITEPYHRQLFGFQVSVTMAALTACCLFFIPGVGFLAWKDTRIPWDLMLFSAGAYATGMALEHTGAASWALEKIFGAVGLAKMPFWMVFAEVMAVAIFSHMVFTSKTVRTIIMIPAIIRLAQVTGHPPIALALPAAITICDAITLPPNCKPNLIFYSTGQFSVFDQLRYGLLVLVAKWGLLVAGSLLWFRLLGVG